MSNLRLLWATPFSARSTIGGYSRQVCIELAARGVGVEILRTETAEWQAIEALPGDFTVHAASPSIEPDFLRSFDAVVVNIGNHADDHGYALSLMTHSPLVSIVHDADLRDLVRSATARGSPFEAFARHPQSRSQSLPANDPAVAEVMLIASLSCACVVHRSQDVERLQAACPGPVANIPLCDPAQAPTSYVDRLIPVIEDAVLRAPVIEAARSVGRTLHMMTVTPADPAAARIDSRIERLFRTGTPKHDS